MLNEEFYKINDRKSPFNQGIVFMPVIVKSDMAAIIEINALQCNDGSSEIAADIFNYRIGIRKSRLSINIKAIFIFAVDKGLGCFERRANARFEEIEESGLKGFPKESIVKMIVNPPETVIRETAFRNEAVDMWIPLQGTAKCMKDTDKARNKVFRFVEVKEHTQDNTADSVKKALKKRTVFKKEVP